MEDKGAVNYETAEEAQKRKVKEARQKLYRETKPYRIMFATPDGKAILEDLKREFDPRELCGTDPHITVVRAACRDVVRYIETMINFEVDDDDIKDLDDIIS